MRGSVGNDETIIVAIGDEPSPEMVLMMQEVVEQPCFSHPNVGHLQELSVAKLEGHSNVKLASVLGALSGRLSVVCTSFEQNVSRS